MSGGQEQISSAHTKRGAQLRVSKSTVLGTHDRRQGAPQRFQGVWIARDLRHTRPLVKRHVLGRRPTVERRAERPQHRPWCGDVGTTRRQHDRKKKTARLLDTAVTITPSASCNLATSNRAFAPKRVSRTVEISRTRNPRARDQNHDHRDDRFRWNVFSPLETFEFYTKRKIRDSFVRRTGKLVLLDDLFHSRKHLPLVFHRAVDGYQRASVRIGLATPPLLTGATWLATY